MMKLGDMEWKAIADGKQIWKQIQEKLREAGIDISELCDSDLQKGPKIKVVCVAPDLKESVKEVGEAPRDQVVMVRIDEETSSKLDAWVETGAVKSRSEAAAVFIREGLKVRAAQLAQLEEALHEMEEARRKLRQKARQVFGETETPDAGEQSED